MLETGTFPCGVLGHTEIRNGSQISSRCGVGWRCPILCCGVDWRIIDLWCSRRPSSSITKREISHGRRLFLITVAEVGHHTLINIHDSAMCDPFWIISNHTYFLQIDKMHDSNSHNPAWDLFKSVQKVEFLMQFSEAERTSFSVAFLDSGPCLCSIFSAVPKLFLRSYSFPQFFRVRTIQYSKFGSFHFRIREKSPTLFASLCDLTRLLPVFASL